MQPRRVLILYQSSLLAEGLVTLLSQQDQLEVKAEKFSDHLSEHSNDRFLPDVIIIDRDELPGQDDITIGDLLSTRSGIKVIDVSTRNKNVRLYEGRELCAAEFEDLLTAINDAGQTTSQNMPPTAAPRTAGRQKQGGT